MPPVPLLRPKDVIKVFEKFGWQIARQKGSHIMILQKSLLPFNSAANCECLRNRNLFTTQYFINSIT